MNTKGTTISQLTKEDVHTVATLLGVTAVYYLLLIFQFPQFYLDDYYVFSRISISSLPISIHPSERYYLFVRPIEYLYFWLIYSIAGPNPVVMKFFGLLLLMFLLIAMYCTIRRVQEFLDRSVPRYATALACLFFALHPDVVSSILWISNSNEVLMALFYCGSIYFLLDDEYAPRKLVISFVFFFLASLVKQQPLHYPFLIAFLLILRWKSLNDQARRNLIIVAAVGMMVIAVHTIVNYRVYVRPSDIDVVGSMWKKPFSIVGTIFYLVFPLWGVDLYFQFLQHKQAAVLLTVLLLVPFCLIVYRSVKLRKLLSSRSFILAVIFVVIIFFPRMFAPGGIRLNTVQLFWLTLAMSIALSSIFKFRAYVVIGLLVINILAGRGLIAKYNRVDRQIINASLGLHKTFNNQPAKIYIITGTGTKLLAYISHYLIKNGFGIDRDYTYSPIAIVSFDGSEFDFHDITLKIEDPSISVSISNQSQNRSFLTIDYTSNEKITKTNSSPLRGYERIDFEPSPPMSDTTVVFVYYDGTEWHQLQKAL